MSRPRTHREAYPTQYQHELVGKRVRVIGSSIEYTVERVVGTRFGLLAPMPGDGGIAYAIKNLEVIA